MSEQIHETVRQSYATAARQVLTGASSACCGADASCTPAVEPSFGGSLYSELERDSLPDAAVLASLGCGNPIAVADLRPGEVVLDLGSGGGIDVLLSSNRVGAEGKVYGLDMTEE